MTKDSYRRMTHDELVKYVDKLCDGLKKYLSDNKIKVDYICPVLRSGGIPAVYISNRLNIIKFLPFQVKHISYNDGRNTTEIIYNPLNNIEINKTNPVFLVVEAVHSTGNSVKLCINEIRNKYPQAIILYVSLAKAYGSDNFKELVNYEDTGYYYNGKNQEHSKEECDELGIDYFHPLFPWEVLDMELSHPDDLEDNIYF